MQHILVIFPTTFEAKAPMQSLGYNGKIKTRAKYLLKSQDAKKEFCFLISGMGCPNTIKFVGEVAKEFAPDTLILCGFAGSCDTTLKNGDFVFDSEEDNFSNNLKTFCREGKIKCSDHLVEEAEKKELFEQGKCAVEMESEFFATEIRKYIPELKLVHIRCISDSVDAQLPAEFFAYTFDSFDGTLSLRKIALYTLRHPSLIIELIKFVKEAKPAQRRYVEKITKFFKEATH